jgi:hypothetical protein
VRDEGANGDASARSGFQGIFEFFKVQAKNKNVDTLLGVLDRREKRRDAIARLYQQLQDRSSVIFLALPGIFYLF